MGLLGDYLRAKMYGHEVREAIKEIKGKKDDDEDEAICSCGRIINMKGGAICKATHWMGLPFLCKKCTKECKRCGKIFCPKHKAKHSCG